MTENDIGYKIRGAIFKVYNELGPGLLESAYENALLIELLEMGLSAETQVPVCVKYRNIELGAAYRLDLLVENKVLVELKSVEKLTEVHHKQVLTYLRLSNIKLGYLVNFNTDNIQKSVIRYANNL